MIVALAFKVISIVGVNTPVYAVNTVLGNEIWFVIGMCVCTFNIGDFFKRKSVLLFGTIGLVLFICASVLVFCFEISFIGMSWLLGTVACASIITIIAYCTRENTQNKIFGFYAQYTLPVFVMHTIFAAGLRAVLMKIGIDNAIVHIIVGIIISFAGPILAAFIMNKTKWLEFLLYPNKFIKVK